MTALRATHRDVRSANRQDCASRGRLKRHVPSGLQTARLEADGGANTHDCCNRPKTSLEPASAGRASGRAAAAKASAIGSRLTQLLRRPDAGRERSGVLSVHQQQDCSEDPPCHQSAEQNAPGALSLLDRCGAPRWQGRRCLGCGRGDRLRIGSGGCCSDASETEGASDKNVDRAHSAPLEARCET